ncbi:MAG TPA: hypothetical protein VF595_12590 [Tepidisphaeraceae bacterium]|jgi:hypothetical protein
MKNTKTKTTRKITIKQALGQLATGAKPSKLYAGEAIQATRLFMKTLDTYKNCVGVTYMAVNESAQTVTYCNAYAAKGADASEAMPRSSYDAATYTYVLKPAVVSKKMDTMIELEKPETWPSFVTLSHTVAKPAARRGRKAAAK